MNALARYLARHLWGHMLWFMRRPWIKRLQRASTNFFPPSRRDRAKQSLIRQNRWARRFGLQLLTVSFNLFLASIVLTTTYFVVLGLYESGTLTVPDALRNRHP